MNGPGEAAGLAFFKLYGIKAGLGMLGAAMLYLVLPPVSKDGRFDRREFVLRLACAGLFSTMFGDWAIDVLGNWSWLHAESHKGAIYLLVGAPGWWVSRGLALWFHNRRGKDLGEMAKDVKETL